MLGLVECCQGNVTLEYDPFRWRAVFRDRSRIIAQLVAGMNNVLTHRIFSALFTRSEAPQSTKRTRTAVKALYCPPPVTRTLNRQFFVFLRVDLRSSLLFIKVALILRHLWKTNPQKKRIVQSCDCSERFFDEVYQ